MKRGLFFRFVVCVLVALMLMPMLMFVSCDIGTTISTMTDGITSGGIPNGTYEGSAFYSEYAMGGCKLTFGSFGKVTYEEDDDGTYIEGKYKLEDDKLILDFGDNFEAAMMGLNGSYSYEYIGESEDDFAKYLIIKIAGNNFAQIVEKKQ